MSHDGAIAQSLCYVVPAEVVSPAVKPTVLPRDDAEGRKATLKCLETLNLAKCEDTERRPAEEDSQQDKAVDSFDSLINDSFDQPADHQPHEMNAEERYEDEMMTILCEYEMRARSFAAPSDSSSPPKKKTKHAERDAKSSRATEGDMMSTDEDSISTASKESYVSLTTDEFADRMASLYADNFLKFYKPPEDEVDAQSFMSKGLYRSIGDKVSGTGRSAVRIEKHSELAKVFCNYGAEEHGKRPYPPGVQAKALCLSKIPDGDFTEIFLHDFEERTTETCQVFTFTPLHVSSRLGTAREYSRKEIREAWKASFKKVLSKTNARWQFNQDAGEDFLKFTHLIFGDCNIKLGFFNPQVSALYMDPVKNDKFSIAFFVEAEASPVDVTFARISPIQYGGSSKMYTSENPKLHIDVKRDGRFWRATMYSENVPIKHRGSRRGVMLLHSKPDASHVYRIKSVYDTRGSESMDQMFFYYLFDNAKVQYAMMRYKAKWAILDENELLKSYETTV
ncbi:hypothetical protein FOL47_002610 [Perkinsus chesapeaki]|uniref:Uncharacterized protein n=1 Tax=Perkinsus chesapeaki TaxID=330153 RepID=A0A7J6MD49_PERCH|nr:hypothetical protein FOL47_002610 [Perkinsus chesapeaki]